MKELGKLPSPQQYKPAGDEVRISNSVEALSFFEDFYEEGGIVLLGNMRFDSETFPNMLVWLYFDLKPEDPRLISSIPVFDVPMDELNGLNILEITPFENEIFSCWHGDVYCSAFTTTGEICIMKIRMLLDSEDAQNVYETRTGSEVENIYPVRLYSHSEHRFIGVCWAVELVDFPNHTFWHPVCLDDDERISSYPPEDLTDHFIENGDIVVIDGDNYKYLIEKGREHGAFKKLASNQNLQKRFAKAYNKHSKINDANKPQNNMR